MAEQNQLTQGRIGPALLRFALPFLLSSFLQALYGAADLFVVGRFADSAAVSAVAIGSQVMHTLTGVLLGISMGGTVLIGRAVGEGNTDKAARAIGTLAVLFGGLALAVTGLMLAATNSIVRLMETPAEAVAGTLAYTLICAAGIPFIAGYNGVSAVFRGLGDSKTPTYFIALACVLNVVADFILVGGFKMGAAGAAIATVLAQGVSFVAALWYLKRRGFGFAFGRRHFRLDAPSVRSILAVGLPLAVQDGLVSGSFLAITAIVNTLGLVASAALGVVEKVIVFAFMPISACASAVAAMAAQNLGAGQPKRARACMWCGVGYSFLFGAAFCLLSQLVPQLLIGLFTKDAPVVLAAAGYLRSYSLDALLVSFIFCINSYFSASGRSTLAFAHSMVATFGVRIPLTWVFSRFATGGSLYVMGLAAPAATAVSLAICLPILIWMKRKE